MASVYTFRDGFDYLPAKFHQYVDDPDVYVLVAESDGKVLAVYVSLTTDDGAYLLNHTLRTAPELQGKKLVKTFLRALDQALLRLYPQLKRCERHGLSDTRRPYMWSYIPKTDICFIASTSNAVLDHLKTSKVLPSPPLPTVVPYQPTDLTRLSGPGFSDQFLNDKIIFVEWIPYKLSARNVRRFSDRGVRILVDTCQPTAKSLSFGGGYMTPRGRLCHVYVDVHCKDVSLCLAHIKNHVDRACLEYEGMITFCVMLIDQSLKITSKTFCVEELGLVHLPNNDHRYLAYKFPEFSF
ncbi:N-acetyltransferase 16 [Branchiostoma belcheri]|nr:N-acetyltransferase 16 [Branchiostoma belcheri]